MIRVLLVDDERLVCEHLRTILGRAEDVEVVGVEYDGAAGVEAAVRLRPDVILMDLRMPGVDGLTAIERISRLGLSAHVVALTIFDVDSYVLRALRSGATGFLLKSTAPDDLVDLVRVAAQGHTVLSPEATARLVADGGRDEARRRAWLAIDGLTGREVDVLRLLGDGRTNGEIAHALGLSEATVKGYVSRVLDKLGCANRTQAGLLAYTAGLGEPSGDRRDPPPSGAKTPRLDGPIGWTGN